MSNLQSVQAQRIVPENFPPRRFRDALVAGEIADRAMQPLCG
jgi:hypothetical protein